MSPASGRRSGGRGDVVARLTGLAHAARAGLDPGGDVHWLHGADRRHAALAHQVRNSSADRVADVDRKEFEEADRGLLAGSGGERRESG